MYPKNVKFCRILMQRLNLLPEPDRQEEEDREKLVRVVILAPAVDLTLEEGSAEDSEEKLVVVLLVVPMVVLKEAAVNARIIESTSCIINGWQ
ncbi:uncharacterized protein LOC135131905 isoform X1 [Zophobas morio]|uniref:uncharacterized protein LOC135131905 isoform X1 n=1 Tax=Zophobas morio TaxID=2755281 RepID=UPI0030832B16